MKTIVFINTQKSGSSREAIQAAKRLGYKTVLLTNKLSHMRNRSSFTDVDDMILCDIDNINDLKREVKQILNDNQEVVGIVSLMDPYVYTASILNQEFNLSGFTKNAIYKMQNKIMSRECIKNTPYAPWYKIINSHYDYQTSEIKDLLPLIVKNPVSTGSKEVYLVNTMDEFYNRVDFLFRRYNKPLIIEKYIEGPQYLIETLVKNNQVHIIAIIEQEIYLYNGHSIVVGYSLKHWLKKELLTSLNKAVNDIIKLHGLEHGSCHLEMRYTNKTWKLVEINPRISGGAMNDIIRFGLGINLVEETLNLVLNEPLNVTPKFQMFTNTQYLVCTVSGKLIKVTGRKEALNSQGVIKVFVKPKKGQMIYPPISMGYRYCYVIANGLSEEDARVNAKRALNKMKLHVLKE